VRTPLGFVSCAGLAVAVLFSVSIARADGPSMSPSVLELARSAQTFAVKGPVATARSTDGAVERVDTAPQATRGAVAARSFGWVTTVMGASGLAVGSTFLGLSAAHRGDDPAARTMATTDRSGGYAAITTGAVLMGVGVVALALGRTDVARAWRETVARMGPGERPALRIGF